MYVNTKNLLTFSVLPSEHYLRPSLAVPVVPGETLPDGSRYVTVLTYFDEGVSDHVAQVVRAQNFDDISRCALVLPSSPFYQTARSLIAWYNEVWAYVAQEQQKLEAGEREFMPLAEFIKELPAYEQ